ncbi:MAG: molybdopterin-dependent oxidoreductase, partial [Hyphomicrobium sp.]
DGLKRQRLDRPYVRRAGRLQPATWGDAFAVIRERLAGLDGNRIAAVAGDLACCESMLALKDLMAQLASPNLDCRQDGARLEPAPRASYLFNTTIAGIEAADACLLIGTNPRVEAAIINARIRKRYRMGSRFPIGLIGPKVELTYRYEHLGETAAAIRQVLSGEHGFAEKLRAAERPMVVLGMSALVRPDGAAVLAAARQLCETYGLIDPDAGWNGFNVLHTAAARVGGMDLGFLPAPGGRDVRGILEGVATGDIDVVYLLGADELDTRRLEKAFVIYQGHTGDAGAQCADVVLPGAAYTEKDAIYVNTEGRVQMARRVVQPPGQAREDWAILRALAEALDKRLPYDTLEQLRERLVESREWFSAVDEVVAAEWGEFGTPGDLRDEPFAPVIGNFYLTNPICRASVTMAECAATFGERPTKTGTHG